MKNFKFFLLSTIICLLGVSVVEAQSGKFKIGNEVSVDISTEHPYGTEKAGVVFQKEFYSENAGYVKIHFKDFNLGVGDYVRVYSPDTQEEVFYADKGKIIADGAEMISDFWTASIWSDRIVVELISEEPSNGYGFNIDKVAYGYTKEEIMEAFSTDKKSICGRDDKEWAKCHEGTVMYEKAKTVCRLLIDGTYACTGWLLGSEGHIMTNNHCIENQSSANNTEYEFMGEGRCRQNCSGWFACRGNIEAYSGQLVKTSSRYDYSLVKLAGNLSNKYGYLSFRSTLPSMGERIYIPQHPGGKGKQLSVYDDQANDYSNVDGFSTNNVAYYADTEGGSSGSPVIAYSDNKVVALHNLGGCKNSGVKNTKVINHLGNAMPANGLGGGSTTTPTCSDGIQNGDETGVDCGGSCPNICDNPSNNCPPSHPYECGGRCFTDAAQAASAGCHESAERIGYKPLTVFPNPTAGEFKIQLYSGEESDVDVKIYNNQGQLVFNKKMCAQGGNNTFDVSTQLPTGVYSVNITTGQNTEKQKLMIK